MQNIIALGPHETKINFVTLKNISIYNTNGFLYDEEQRLKIFAIGIIPLKWIV